MRRRRHAMACILGIFTILTVSAAVETVVDLNLFHSLNLRDTGTRSHAYLMKGDASVSLKSPNTSNVRGDVALSFSQVGTTIVPSIDRAYLRARFPSFRLTVGKTRVSWGDGVMFNAADLLFGSTSTGVDLTRQELRSDTKWLTSINYPLGAFSFIEALVIPPEDPLHASVGNTSLGARYYTTLGSVKLETGAAYRNDAHTGNVVSPYLGLQGNIGPDWYVATSANIPYPEDIADELKDSWIVSAGLLHILTVGWQGTLSMRLETLLLPFAHWEPDPSHKYALYLYPELSYAPNETLSFLLRSIMSPIDLSATITAGASWNVFQGLSIQTFVTAFTGEEDDLFPWRKAPSEISPSLNISVGVSWVY